ncbi:STAS domain-containing protein [Xanthomonas prunicola]|uniref:STAS domain-containing protein n=1 Tax=Xanthomonas prunicola TaxID=2053930 RepID=A0A9Q9J4K5_9XANT|nr:STAS domain-containing protein [Xanthomonas prunicola]USJ01294.1 STAS domain-containing protein [Xanthomonas prunicola]UXA49829.1 STAS domain-containing protein [Xanthomonas prunicola]UXA55362.1 STAS domain-containing protein [Xanthomonas prunicola]UXA58125.1 STAS domain-containing protein [Xanthomonas prunicola]UXA60275.1 STAS domain-containing protein [Xanthomonas prunicola]
MVALQQRSIDAIRGQESALLAAWLGSSLGNDARLSRQEFEAQAGEFLRLLVTSLKDDGSSLDSAEWSEVRRFLENLSRDRATRGFDSQETANFIFSLKRVLFALVQREYASTPEDLGQQLWALSELLDRLGLYTVKAFQKTREDIIVRQQEEMLELSTPVVKLWEGVLALPMIGTLDSQRTQVVMESLLQRIVDTGSEIAIIDITGVPTVDTLVAQHLLKTVTAIRLMGADAIISGVRPQIAQTIVHLGLDLQGIVTKANLSDALALALKRIGVTVGKAG